MLTRVGALASPILIFTTLILASCSNIRSIFPEQSNPTSLVTLGLSTGSLSPAQTTAQTVTPTLSNHVDQWSSFTSHVHGIRFEYPSTYDLFKLDPVHKNRVDCRPEIGRVLGVDYIIVSDYIEIDILQSEFPSILTPTPFGGYDSNWRLIDQLQIEVAGVDTTLVKGKEVAVRTEEGVEDYRDIWISSISIGDKTIIFRYKTKLFGTPWCMYTYHTSDKEIFLHILNSFEFIE